MLDYAIWCLIGTLYGIIVGIVPVAGATTGIIAAYGLASYFSFDPYLGVVFITSMIAASSTADSFTSILTGIPGSNTTAASVIDGHQMAKQGQGVRALSIALLDSTLNGVFWGSIVLLFIPFYSKLILYFGVPEFAAFMLVSILCVSLLTTKNLILSALSIIVGLSLGFVGTDPNTSAPRLTFGFEYLEAGIQIMPIIAGLFAVPEIVEGLRNKNYRPIRLPANNYWSEMLKGFKDCIKHPYDMVRGGVVGFIVGMLPGVSSLGDLISYSLTVSRNKLEKFGNGNVKGLIGCEGANNAQKVSALIPTILFGVPAAPFAAVMMGFCVYFGIEIGTSETLKDQKFLDSLAYSFVASTILVFIISIFTIRYLVKILEIPYPFFVALIVGTIVYSCLEYTGGIEDIIMLVVCGIVGIVVKHLRLSAPAIMLCFMVAPKLENYTQQTYTMYNLVDVIQRPITVGLLIISAILLVWTIGFRKPSTT
jgi:TctA family transporter